TSTTAGRGEALRLLVNDRRFRDHPMILETPRRARTMRRWTRSTESAWDNGTDACNAGQLTPWTGRQVRPRPPRRRDRDCPGRVRRGNSTDPFVGPSWPWRGRLQRPHRPRSAERRLGPNPPQLEMRLRLAGEHPTWSGRQALRL